MKIGARGGQMTGMDAAQPEAVGPDRLRIGVLASQGDFAAHARALESLGAISIEVRAPDDLRDLDGLVIPGGESTTITKAIERDGLAPAIRSHVERGRPILGTCAGMIVCDREHLGLVDAVARRNAFGRQIASFEAELAMDGLGPEPIRAVFIRAPWIEDHGPAVRGPGRHRRTSGGGARGRGAAVRLPPGAHRRLPRPRSADGDGHRGPPASRDRAGECEELMRDPRVNNLARILVRYSTEVKEGDTCVIEGPTAGEPLIAAVYEEVMRAGGHPVLALSLQGQLPTFFERASDAQLEWVSPALRVGGQGGGLPDRDRRRHQYP